MAPQTTSPTSAKSPSRLPSKRASGSVGRSAGFTLTELLVVIGIIVLLAAIVIPMALKAYAKGRRARTAADLQSISVALDAYKADFGDYPRVGANQAGAATLGLALIGPYGGPVTDLPTYNAATTYNPGDVVTNGTATFVSILKSNGKAVTDAAYWTPFPTLDGYAGPGFKARAGGRVRQPYMAEGKVKTRGMDIIDADGSPILYFPASLARPNVNLANGYVAQENRTPNALVVPLYNVLDNSVPFDPTVLTAQTKIRVMLGDANSNGQIDAGETAVTAPYLLWSAGFDARYGPKAAAPSSSDVSKCDDVTNFR